VQAIQQAVAPVVSLTAPLSGTTATIRASIAPAATAPDPDGFVTAVDFLIFPVSPAFTP
jgi:hypothetical protein